MKKMGKKTVRGKQAIAIGSMILLLMAGVTGCGSKEASQTEDKAANYAGTEMATASEPSSAEGEMQTADMSTTEMIASEEAVTDSSSVTVGVVDESRKLIKNVTLDVETETFVELVANVESKVGELEGYIENLTIGDNYTYTETGSLQYATITARIPVARLDEFVKMMDSASNVINRSEYVTDVTLQYVDMESRKEMYLAEQKSLLALLEKAVTVEDIITIESRLSEVRYEIESMESQLRVYDNQVDYSTITLYINEVERLTPEVKEGTLDKIKTGISENFYKIGQGIKNTAVNVIIATPYIVIWGVILIVAFLLLRKLFKKNKKQSKKENVPVNENQADKNKE